MAEYLNILNEREKVIKAKYCCDFRDCFFAAYRIYEQTYISRVKATKKCQDARDVASIEALADDFDKSNFDLVFNVLKNQIPC